MRIKLAVLPIVALAVGAAVYFGLPMREAWTVPQLVPYTLYGGKWVPSNYVPPAILGNGIAATKIGGGSVDNAEFGYIGNLTSDAQAQIDGKLATNGDASSLTNIPAGQLTGDVARPRISTALAAGGDPVAGTVLTAATRTESPTIGQNSTQQHTLPAVASDTITLNAATQTLTNKTISGASNTITNVSLTTGVTGTLPVANGGTGQATFSAGNVLVGNGTSPLTVAVPGAAGQVLTSNGAGVTPSFQTPVTSANGVASLSASPYSLTTTGYEDIGLSVALPAAGTYDIWADVRQALQLSAAPNGFITCKFYNSTDASDISNSFRLGAVATATGVVFTGTWSMRESSVTVAAAKTIQTRCKRNAGPTYTTSQIVSDTTDGSTRMGFVRLN